MAIQVVILAAGKGQRMHSDVPKVLHCIGGKPLLEHVIATAITLAPHSRPIIVYGHQGEKVKTALEHFSVSWVQQTQQLGTGHALAQALPFVAEDDQVLVLYGDVPLISVPTLKALINATSKDELGMLTVTLINATGYGRIKRNAQQQIIGIIEEKDATPIEKQLTEINPGIYLVNVIHLKKWLPQLKNNNLQQEYYLTDMIACAAAEEMTIRAVTPTVTEEILGVNDCLQLATLERFYQRRCAEKLLLQGVTLYDPLRFDLRGDLTVGRDVKIDINVIIEGRVLLGDRCVIGPNVVLRNCVLSNDVEVRANTVIDGAEVAARCTIGPFARLRPGTQLLEQVHIGNFVEIKNSEINTQSKVNHLSYIGDTTMGARVNVGAGTITCNYDGVNKHQTVIGDDVFIGSDTQLVAPVTIGDTATIAAGSTITQNVPAKKLTLTQVLKQRTMEGWHRPDNKGK